MIMVGTRPLGKRRDDVLHTLAAAAGPMTIGELSERLDVHPNTVRFHLRSLVAAGRVEQRPSAPDRPGRPALLFAVLPGMDPSGPRNYRLLAEILDSTLRTLPDAAERAVDAGRAWGAELADQTGPEADDEPTGRLLGLLEQAGFGPERSADHDQHIELRHCPFLEIARSGSRTACQVHLGLMRGALEHWGAAETVDRLDVFVEPDLCRAHLAGAAA